MVKKSINNNTFGVICWYLCKFVYRRIIITNHVLNKIIILFKLTSFYFIIISETLFLKHVLSQSLTF